MDETPIDSIEYKIYPIGLVRSRAMYHRICLELEVYYGYLWIITNSGDDRMSEGLNYTLKLDGIIIGEGDQYDIGDYKEHIIEL